MPNSLKIIYLTLFLALFSITPAISQENPLLKLKSEDSPDIKVSLLPAKYLDNKAYFSIKFELPDGWKMYGKEPGDTGLPTTINLSNSSNIESHQINWPEPQKMEDHVMDETLVSHVYKGTVLLPIQINAIDPSSNINIEADIEFGACKEVCIRQEKKLSLLMQPGFLDSSLFQQDPPESATSTFPLGLLFIFAVIGGLILNIMPCVLPVLSLKLFNVVKYAGLDRRQVTVNLLATSFGIIFSFWLLAGVTTALQATGKAAGWGFHFQEPGFIIFLIVVLVLFASNLWGDFELKLPSFLSDRINNGKPDTTHSINNSIATGAFATLLATPCTAPFLSTSVAFALSQDIFTIFFTYSSIGLGMALPYIGIAVFPKLIEILPKPGSWMVTLKKTFSLLLILTAVWLLYVLTFQVSLQAVLILTGAIVILKFVLYEQKYIKSITAKVILIALTVTAVFAIPTIMEQRVEAKKQAMEAMWEPFDQQTLDRYIAESKTILVDVTAEWCLICKTNKLLVLEKEDIMDFLSKENVVLIRADYTNRSKIIAKYLVKNNRYGIPLNVVYGPSNQKGVILPEILTKPALIEAIKKVQ